MSDGRREILPLGLAPRYLSREQAAAYVGVAVETFDQEVREGWWPPARRRGARGGRLTWDRIALDAAADRASGIAPAQANGSTPSQLEADLDAAAERAALEAIRAASRNRPKHSQPPKEGRNHRV